MNRTDRKIDWRSCAVGVVLLFGTLLLFRPAVQNGFLDLDDPDYVTQNPHVHAGLTWNGFKWAMTTGFSANWHPLTWLSLMLDAQLYGDFPGGFHFTNSLLHAFNAVLAFLALRKLTGRFWPSAFCAALFAWHPLRVESVAWVAERKDVLSGFFFFLTLLAYASYAEVASRLCLDGSSQNPDDPATRRTLQRHAILMYALALLVFAFGLMSKPMLVTIPFLLLLLDFWPLERFSLIPLRQLIIEKIPFLSLSLVSSVITFFVQKNWGAVVNSQSLIKRLENASVSNVRYLAHFIYPPHLAIVYPMPNHWPIAIVLAAVAFIALITVLAVFQIRRRPWLFAGWFWFLGMLVPVIGIVQVGLQAMADRYTYLPILGIELALIYTVAPRRQNAANKNRSVDLRIGGLNSVSVSKSLYANLALILLFFCATLTVRQFTFWQSPKSLFEHALAVTRNNYAAECYLGTSLLNENHLADAEAHFCEAIRLKPDFNDAWFKLGATLTQAGRIDEALSTYKKLLQINPTYALAEYNIGMLLLDRNPADAIPHFESTLRKKTDYGAAWVALGTACAKLGQSAQAISYFKKDLANHPDNAIAHYNVANTLNDLHRDSEALAHYETALQLDPKFEEAECNYANALGNLGRHADARDHFRRALMLNPKNAGACFGLAVAFEDLGNIASAIACYKRSIVLDPGNPNAHYNLATIILNQNDADDALKQFQSAAQLEPANPSPLLGIGLCEEKLRHIDAAIANFRHAVALAPASAQAHCCLGIALRIAGNYPEAIAQDEAALRLNPDLPGLRNQLALARRQAMMGNGKHGMSRKKRFYAN